METRVSRA